MINTAPPASNSVYGSQKLFKYNKINPSKHDWHCGEVVKELVIAHADRSGSTPGDAVFFYVKSLVFNPIFSFWFVYLLVSFVYPYC